MNLSGLSVSAEGDPLRTHAVAAGSLGPGQFLVLTEQQLRFRPADGENVFLYAAGTQVLDGQRLTGSLRARRLEGRCLALSVCGDSGRGEHVHLPR